MKCLQKRIVKNSPKKVTLEEVRDLLPMLTINQLSLMTGAKKRVNWTTDEIANGFAMSFFSTRGYNYLINKLQIPEPSVRTLQEWGENVSVKPGILNDSLTVLKALRETLTDGESQVYCTWTTCISDLKFSNIGDH